MKIRYLATTVAVLALMSGCANVPDASKSGGTGTSSATPAPTTDTPVSSTPATPSRPTGSRAPEDDDRGFATASAYYEPASFASLPGWKEDNLKDALKAFDQTCTAYRNRADWTRVCQQASRVNGNDNAAIRKFYETEFSLYQVHNLDRTPDGTVTGYFEPLLKGSRKYGAPYIHPVYKVPTDMVFMDLRKLPKGSAGKVLPARLDGQNVTVVSAREGQLTLDLTKKFPEPLDRKLRLRKEGNQLVPYYTREEIESLGAPNASVIAFVDSVQDLYTMQVQGAGRIEMSNGEVVRVSYAEQNGHPFMPEVSGAAGKSGVKVRGGFAELEADEDDEAAEGGAVLTRGFRLSASTGAAAGATAGAGVRRPAGPSAPSGRAGAPAAGAVAPSIQSAINRDPSYVFFQETPNRANNVGPSGAMGVPLTPGSSIAVDPRAVPLGTPVFLATQGADKSKSLRKLTVAQDTGGAVRGAVRADYFYGFGQNARTSASRMKQKTNVWVLLPKDFRIAAREQGPVVRGSAQAPLTACLIQDDFCGE